MTAIIFMVTIILMVSYLYGRFIKQLFFKDEKFNYISIGFFSLLGLLQFVTYFMVLFKISTKFMLVSYLLIFILGMILCLKYKINLKPDKNDLVALIFALIIVVIGLLRIQNYTLNEKYLDSSFYLSMVNENSVRSFYGGMNYYSGVIQEIDYTYDFASFYALFSMLLKLARNLNLIADMTTPIYFYASTITYLIMFAATIEVLISKFLAKNIYKISLFLSITSFIFFKYYHYALAFIGNSYRIIAVSLALMFVYMYLENRRKNYILLTGLLFSGLMAVSSSGAFMGLFFISALIIYFIFKEDKEGYMSCLYAFIPVLIFIPLIFIVNKPLISLIIIILILSYYLIIFFFLKRNYKFIFKLQKTIIIILLLILLLLSYFIQSDGIYKYGYFFNDHSAYDMVHDYFSYYHKKVFYPTLSIWFLCLHYFIKSKDYFKKVLLILLIVFLNPFIMPFIIKYLTNFVFYRAFELVFNLFTLTLFVFLLDTDRIGFKIISILLIMLVIPYSYKQFSNNFSKEMIAKEGYDAYYRISKNEVDLYREFNKILNGNHAVVLSQVASSKAYINNIELVFSVFDTRVADQYNEVKQKAPSELLNIFFPRDFVGQIVYDTLPDYNKMNDLVVANKIDYLILKKDQAIVISDNEFLPVYLKLREIADIIYENSEYVIMKSRYAK